jgi:hypothetical protein
MSKFSVTEFRQRLRPLTRQMAAMEGLERGEYSIEIDQRLVPVSSPVLPAEADLVAEGDDLFDHLRVDDRKSYLDQAGLLEHGAVVHVRVYRLDRSWGVGHDPEVELRNVFMAWMGTPEQDARIVSAPALRTYEDLVGAVEAVASEDDWSEFTQGETLPPADDAFERFSEERDAWLVG